MILLIFNAIIVFFSILIKIVYYISKFFLNSVIYVFHSKTLRVPFLLLLLRIFFKISISYISTLYFLFLVHTFAIKLKIYLVLKNNFLIFYKNLLSKLAYKRKFKNINSEYILLNNLYWDINFNNSFSRNTILITKCGVFNLKVLSTTDIDYISDKNSALEHKNYIFNNTYLREVLPLEVPISNLLILPEAVDSNSFYYHNSTPLIPINYLNDYVENKFKKPMEYTPQYIKDILLDSSALIIDRILIFLDKFLTLNRPIIIFSLLSLLIYYIYINLITLLINYF